MTNASEERFFLPERLNAKAAFSFSKSLARVKSGRPIVFDYSKLGFATPFPALLTAAVIRRHAALAFEEQSASGESTLIDHQGIDVLGNKAHGYLGHIGFFRFIGAKAGKHPGEASGSDSYVPITVLTRQALQEEASLKARHIGDILVGHAERLATVIALADGLALHEVNASQLFKASAYCIREILRNAIEHSGAEQVLLCAQYYKKLKTVEVGILDEGIGINTSLARLHGQTDVRTALELAVRPGVSGVSAEESSRSGKWGNSGFGLYTTSKLCTYRSKGAFCLASNGEALSIQKDGQQFSGLHFSGTAVMLKFSMSESLSYDELLERFIEEGQRTAGIVRLKPVASAMSRVF